MGPSSLHLSASWLLVNVLIHVIFVYSTGIPNLSVNETDRFALLEFKASITEDPLGVLSSWNASVHHCQWHGVTCGPRHQRVTVLDLSSEKLAGSITPHVGNLSFLWALYLPNNSFTGVIPTELCHLRKLRSLGLNNNSLSGEIPANISSCSNLVVLALNHNNLIGKIPMEFGSLSKLRLLRIQHNNLSGGIPPSLGNLSYLEELLASRNNFLGNIPNALGRLKKLTLFVLSSNSLSGNIPPSLFNLSSITNFYVNVNQIQGTLPSDLGITLPNLIGLNVASNKFIGSVPVSLSNATSLRLLSLSFNKLTGNVPNFWNLNELQKFSIAHNLLGAREADDLSFLSSLTNATNLEIVVFHANNFGGMLPKSIGNLSNTMKFLSIGGNHITGTIPIGLHNLDQLQILSIQSNHFTGSIPTTIGKLTKLQLLNFRDNKFSGSIPSSIGNLSLVNKMSLAKNNLKGRIPSSLGKCKRLIALDLSLNNLGGTIPESVVGISSLSLYLDISYNHLSGSLPMEVGSLKNLGILDISENKLSGEIPSALGSCVSLEVVYMDANYFQGIIPPSLSSLRGIQNLDLSRNNLSGKIPDFLEGFDLHYLNLSFNNFDGSVPREGIFKNASVISIDGNNKLCGGIPELRLPICSNERSTKTKFTFTLKLSIFIISGIAGLCFLLCFLYFFRSKNAKKESSSDSRGNSLLNVSYQGLLEATGGFSSANLVGAGSFGSVYKGILDHNGTEIAVKVLNLSCQGAAKSFTVECEASRNIRHRNLVKVLTACSGVDHQGNDFKALVYEFMVNGSLEEWLRPSSSHDETPKKLNFLQRLNVAIDVSCALDYLHHHCHTPIIHCDLKPSNVLLDNEMIARVGDFGLAKFIQEATENSSANQASSIGVRGSIGYTAPEYGMVSELSTYGDVYSYGILVLEMFTGKRPTDEKFKDGENLHNYAKTALPDRVAEIADPVIVQEMEEDNTHGESSTRTNKVEECLISVIGVGVACSTELARERMNMSEVAARLHSIWDNFLGNGIHRHRGTTSTAQHLGN